MIERKINGVLFRIVGVGNKFIVQYQVDNQWCERATYTDLECAVAYLNQF